MHECLNAISTDAIESFGNPVQWCKCLPYALLDFREPTLDAYLEDWARANACDEAHVRAALLDVRALCYCSARATVSLLAVPPLAVPMLLSTLLE